MTLGTLVVPTKESPMKEKFVERFAVPMFSIGLLALVLGVFAMNQSASYGAAKPVSTTPLATRTVTISYLALHNETGGFPLSCGGDGAEPIFYSSPIPLVSVENGEMNKSADVCHITLKVLK